MEDDQLPSPLDSTREMEHLLEHLDHTLFLTTSSPTYVDVSVDAKSCLAHLYDTVLPPQYDHETTNASSYIPPWVLPPHITSQLRERGMGVAPDLIYARGAPKTPSPDPSTFDKRACSLD